MKAGSSALACALMAALLLAGCSGTSTTSSTSHPPAISTHSSGSSPPPSASPSSTPTSSPPSSTPTTSPSAQPPPPTPYHAPTASLSAQANGLNVTFSLTGADPDHNPLNWTLDSGDGSALQRGSQLPTQLNHTYAASGNYTATLTVSNAKLSTKATAVVSAVPLLTHQVLSAHWLVDNVACAAGASSYSSLPTNDAQGHGDGLAYVSFKVVAGTVGKHFTANFTGNGILDHLTFFDAGGKVLKDFSRMNTAPPFTIGDVVPAASALGVFWSCASGYPGEKATYAAGP